MLEQKSIGYVYPCEVASKDRKQSDVSTAECDDWQIVVPLNEGVDDNGKKELKDTESVFETDGNENYGESPLYFSRGLHYRFVKSQIFPFLISDATSSTSGILPATRARLVSLKDFGAKKIGALRLKLAESRIKQTEKG